MKYLLFVLISLSLSLFGEEEPKAPEKKIDKNLISEEKVIGSINVTELILTNGMRVFLKPYDNGENIISIQLTAIGGYKSFPENQQAAARLSPDIAWESSWESGFTNSSCADLLSLLNDYSIEFSYSVEPWYRFIIAAADPDSMKKLLELITCFMEYPKFDEKAFQEIIHSFENQKASPDKDAAEAVERNYYEINGFPNVYSKQLTPEEVKNVKLNDVKEAFQALFANPNEFVCVIAGDFSVSKMKEDVLSTLAGLKWGTPLKIPRVVKSSFNPNEHLAKTILQKNRSKAFVRLSFPFPFTLTEENFFKMELACQALEVSLRRMFVQKYKSDASLDVSFEVPVYPLLNNPWMLIEFHAPPRQRQTRMIDILDHLQKVQRDGLSTEDLKTAQQDLKASDDFWQNEDEYWLSLVSDAALFGWNVDKFFLSRQATYSMSLNDVNDLIRKFNFTNYTAISATSE